MQAKDLKHGSLYDIKDYSVFNPFEYRGIKKKKNAWNGTTDYHIFVSTKSDSSVIEKYTCHGVTENKSTVPVQRTKSQVLPKTKEYDSLSAEAEMLAAFLRAIDIEAGVVDVDSKDEIIPTIFIFPAYFSRIQELIQKVYLQKMENQ